MIPVRFDHEQVQAIDEVMSKIGARSRSEFVREAVRHHLDTVKEMKIIRVRSLSKEQAKREIVDYLKGKKEAETFEIANDLRLELELTVQALKELWEEGSKSSRRDTTSRRLDRIDEDLRDIKVLEC